MSEPHDISGRRIAERYADDAAFKAEVDRALGVYHIPAHPKGECEGCDAARAKGLVES